MPPLALQPAKPWLPIRTGTLTKFLMRENHPRPGPQLYANERTCLLQERWSSGWILARKSNDEMIKFQAQQGQPSAVGLWLFHFQMMDDFWGCSILYFIVWTMNLTFSLCLLLLLHLVACSTAAENLRSNPSLPLSWQCLAFPCALLYLVLLQPSTPGHISFLFLLKLSEIHYHLLYMSVENCLRGSHVYTQLHRPSSSSWYKVRFFFSSVELGIEMRVLETVLQGGSSSVNQTTSRSLLMPSPRKC